MVGKWHLGFFEWAYTPTYRGFDSHYGFYTGCGDHYTHERLGILDLRDNTAAVRDMNGTYSANLFTKVRSTIYPFIKSCFQLIMKWFTQFCGCFPYRSAYDWNSVLRCSDKWKTFLIVKNQDKVILSKLFSFPTIKQIRHHGKRIKMNLCMFSTRLLRGTFA